MHFMTAFLALLPLRLYLLLFAAVLCFALYYLVYSRHVARWKKSNIPFLRPSFLVGHKYFSNLMKKSCVVSMDRIYKENADKDVVGFFLATMPVVMIRNLSLINEIFVKNYQNVFEPGMFAGYKNDEIIQNMVNMCSDKNLWRSNRRTLSPMVASSRLSGEAFAKLRTQNSRLWAHTEQLYRTRRPLDVREVATIYMADCFSDLSFSVNSNSYEKPGEIYKVFKFFLEPSVANVLRAFTAIQFPGAQRFEPLKFVNKKLIDTLTNIIQEQVKNRNQDGSDKNDFVDFLMKLKKEESSKRSSETDVTNQMIGFAFVAAFGIMDEAVPCTCITVIHLLSLYPEYQERIRREVSKSMELHKTSEFTYEVVQDLHFTDQCIHESLRLIPTFQAFTRICTEDFNVPGMNYTFKKGERIMINPYSIHRDPAYFKNPNEFDPARFSPENIKTMYPGSYLGFGIGPRKCPGEKLGSLMVATFIAALVCKYEIKPRSHLKQMDAEDFSPKSFGTIQRERVLVDIVPREVSAH